ncbi:hypothetical protein [Escherichia coli]|uniref:hypothetical protein n=1 Tax=Escherichia coli TaxID=562 RepID=UPI001A93A460|nr:hypothetical protein [Escherichia coli]MBO0256087.1 hypothetical protein [Escherichia coli]
MITAIKYVHASSLGELEQFMPALISAGWQPFNDVVVERNTDGWDFYQSMIQGSEGTLPSNQAVVTDSSTYPLYGSDGTTNQNTTVTPVVASGILARFKLAASYTALSNAVAVAVRNSAGANSHSGTSVVTAAGVLTGINLPATTAMIDNGDAVTMQNSAGTAIAGTHQATIAAGVISNVKLAATIAPVANASVQASVPVTNNAILAIGTVNRQVTYTVAGGVVTGLTIV